MQTSAAKQLLEKSGSPMDSATLFKALEMAGLVEQCTYLSSSGSGELKKFWSFTNAGLMYGINQATLSATKTELRFFEEKFRDVLVAAAEAIVKHAKSVGDF